MSTVTAADGAAVETKRTETEVVAYEKWNAWPVNWSAVWVGVLTTLAVAVLFGLIAVAIGAHVVDPAKRVVDLKTLGVAAVAASVASAVLAFGIGAWVTGKMAGILRAETAILHGAIVWLTTLPLLLLLIGLGAGGSLGAWYGGLAANANRSADGRPERPEALAPGATEEERAEYRKNLESYRDQLKEWQEETPKVTRNAALFAATMLLLGLIGSVMGGWLASGEPITLRYNRNPQTPPNNRMVRI